APMLDLSRAVVITPGELTGPEEKAVTMLIDEVEKRTQIRWKRFDGFKTARIAGQQGPLIGVGRVATLVAHGIPEPKLPKAPGDSGPKAESYGIKARGPQDQAEVIVAGQDARGVLFGVGRLLRAMEMSKQKIQLRSNFEVLTAPHYPLRGHQLGYRPK